GTRYGVNLDVIKSIEVVDPHTIQIALKAFDPIFLLRMVGYQQGYILSKKAVEKYGEQFKWNPVGTGPFYFERHSPREKVVLKAFDKFHAGRPQIDAINYFDVPEDATKLIGLEKGTFDLLYPEAVTADFADQVKKMGAVIDQWGPGGQQRFYINMTKPPFDDIRVRKAFMHAIDRKAIKETMYPGELGRLAISCVPPGYFGHIPMKFPEYNPDLAKKLLAEAGRDLRGGAEAHGARSGVLAHPGRGEPVGPQSQAREQSVRSQLRGVLAALQLQLPRDAEGPELGGRRNRPCSSTRCDGS